jgi:hypothetical protein
MQTKLILDAQSALTKNTSTIKMANSLEMTKYRYTNLATMPPTLLITTLLKESAIIQTSQ